MFCFHCQGAIQGKPWIILEKIPSKDKDDKDILINKHICGYPCYRRLSENGMLPRDLWSHIVNKEDYKGLIRPVQSKMNKSFEYLTAREFYDLSDIEREKYLEEKESQIELNPNVTEIYDEIMKEDERTAYLEEMSSGEEFPDDY